MQKTKDAVDKIKLIYYLPCLVPGGTEKVVLNLCRNVSRKHFDISVCSMTGGLFADEIRLLGIPVTILSESSANPLSIFGKIVNFSRMLRILSSIINSSGPTLVHSHHYGPLLQLFLLRKFTPMKFGWIHTEHSWTDVRNAYALKLYRLLNPLKSADIISGVADKVTSYMAEVSGISPDKAITVLNGIETDQFRLVDRHAKRRELGFTSRDVVVGTVGMLRAEKNQQLAIRAFALLAAEDENLHLVICGEGEHRTDLERLATELCVENRVHFLGFRMDVHEIMSAFDIYCLPSVYEGLPLSILEAWAANKPVVATNVIGTREIVIDGENGLLVPLNDEKKMAEAILQIMQDASLGSLLGSRGHHVVMNRFDIRQMVNRYELLYEQIAC